MNSIKVLSLCILVLFFSGCMPKQEDVKDAFQSNSANIIKKDYKKIQKHLLSFKEKLDKRNPQSYSKNLSPRIYRLINDLEKDFLLKYKKSTLSNYKDYLQIAFSKDNIVSRNDYLILGLYYLIYDSYELDKGHRVIALEYDKEKLGKLHKNLQILKWKLKVDKDVFGNYLFLTWQNNWQIELAKKSKDNEQISYEKIAELKFIKENKESVFDHSNFSFEILLTQMIDNVENSLTALGEEPKELTVKAMFLFL
ncbi:hypothetical protein [Arcobacter sp. LA11]|uniref:hypothetical protein n=1 Tax=Arcobacter sp. LA11 TaxID=1898176 RepID=UPI000934909B|nr:hypothetical protein [Arcobacter sp. LA11]